jgi:hypothetical protein
MFIVALFTIAKLWKRQDAPLLMNELRKCDIYIQWILLSHRDKILSYAGKWMEVENIILCEVSHAQKTKGHMFSLICGVQNQYKCKQYYEKLVMLMEGHRREREGKRKNLRRWIWLMYFLYKNKYRTFKPVEISIRRTLR